MITNSSHKIIKYHRPFGIPNENLTKSNVKLTYQEFKQIRHIRPPPPPPPKSVCGIWSPRALPQTRTSAFLVSFFFGYETMSNCSQNCWIDWDSAVLCFKRLLTDSLSHHTVCLGNFQ